MVTLQTRCSNPPKRERNNNNSLHIFTLYIYIYIYTTIFRIEFCFCVHFFWELLYRWHDGTRELSEDETRSTTKMPCSDRRRMSQPADGSKIGEKQCDTIFRWLSQVFWYYEKIGLYRLQFNSCWQLADPWHLFRWRHFLDQDFKRPIWIIWRVMGQKSTAWKLGKYGHQMKKSAQSLFSTRVPSFWPT